jgi:hypothetical protein
LDIIAVHGYEVALLSSHGGMNVSAKSGIGVAGLQRHLQLGLVLGVIKIHLLFVDIDLLL